MTGAVPMLSDAGSALQGILQLGQALDYQRQAKAQPAQLNRAVRKEQRQQQQQLSELASNLRQQQGLLRQQAGHLGLGTKSHLDHLLKNSKQDYDQQVSAVKAESADQLQTYRDQAMARARRAKQQSALAQLLASRQFTFLG